MRRLWGSLRSGWAAYRELSRSAKAVLSAPVPAEPATSPAFEIPRAVQSLAAPETELQRPWLTRHERRLVERWRSDRRSLAPFLALAVLLPEALPLAVALFPHTFLPSFWRAAFTREAAAARALAQRIDGWQRLASLPSLSLSSSSSSSSASDSNTNTNTNTNISSHASGNETTRGDKEDVECIAISAACALGVAPTPRRWWFVPSPGAASVARRADARLAALLRDDVRLLAEGGAATLSDSEAAEAWAERCPVAAVPEPRAALDRWLRRVWRYGEAPSASASPAHQRLFLYAQHAAEESSPNGTHS